MKILPPLEIKGQISQPVIGYDQIKSEAEAMLDFIRNGKFLGKYSQAFSLAHAQVAVPSFRFFVVHDRFLEEKIFKHQVIINPEIVPGSEDDLAMCKEACMSFPFRDPVKYRRFTKVTVRYSYPGWLGRLKTREVALQDLPAQMFQHEMQHMEGKNIYFK